MRVRTLAELAAAPVEEVIGDIARRYLYERRLLFSTDESADMAAVYRTRDRIDSAASVEEAEAIAGTTAYTRERPRCEQCGGNPPKTVELDIDTSRVDPMTDEPVRLQLCPDCLNKAVSLLVGPGEPQQGGE